MTEIPTQEEMEATVEADWEKDRRQALRQEAGRRLQRLQSVEIDRERNIRRAKREKEQFEEQARLASEAHLALYGIKLAARLDPRASYSLIYLETRPYTGFVAFADEARAEQVRERLRHDSALYADPNQVATSVSGITIGQYVGKGQLLAVDPDEATLNEMGAVVQAERKKRDQAESARIEATRKQDEAERNRRHYGAPVS